MGVKLRNKVRPSEIICISARQLQDSLKQCPMPINTGQYPVIESNREELIRYDWQVLVGIGINTVMLIGIDRHLAMIEGVV